MRMRGTRRDERKEPTRTSGSGKRREKEVGGKRHQKREQRERERIRFAVADGD